MAELIANFSGRELDLSLVQIMGVLNVTPDSFSDGGKFNDMDAALVQAQKMLDQGASIIDVGGESTRPGAAKVSLQEELDRVCPVVEKLVSESEAIVSVDTSTPEVMRESLSLGAGMINDVRAFSREGAIDAVAESEAMLCVMHMQGEPQTMQESPNYQKVVDDVCAYLRGRANALKSHGVESGRIVVDPGFGFGKTLEHNLALLNHVGKILELDYPVLIGLSRKSMFGAILDKPVDQRLYASIAGAVVAAQQGAHIVRVHDVAETADAVRVINALRLNKSQEK